MNPLKTLALAAVLALCAAALSHANFASPIPHVVVSPGPGGAQPPTTRLLQLNRAVLDALRPFNTADTKAAVIFDRIETSAERALAAEARLDYEKKGAGGRAAANGALLYEYPEGGQPRATVAVKLDFELLNVVTQQQINQFGPMADSMADFLRHYGQPGTFSFRVTRRDVDASGNLKAIALDMGVRIDKAQLPADAAPSALVTELFLKLEVTRSGAELNATIVGNPAHASFAGARDGLKERLEKLLAGDPAQIDEIRGYARLFDRFGSQAAAKRP